MATEDRYEREERIHEELFAEAKELQKAFTGVEPEEADPRYLLTTLARKHITLAARVEELEERLSGASWQEMLGNYEREVSEEEIAALEAEHGPFKAADGEG
jgi:chromosome segregation ATPase